MTGPHAPPSIGPYERGRLPARYWPLGLAAAICLGTAFLELSPRPALALPLDPGLTPLLGISPRWLLLISVLLVAVAEATIILVAWHRLPRVAQAVPSTLFMAGLAGVNVLESATTRHGRLGSSAAMVVMSIIWISIYGNLAEVWYTVAIGMIALSAPAIVTGDPARALETSVPWIAASAVMGTAIQQLVERLQLREWQQSTLVTLDHLTGVKNRRAWTRDLERLLSGRPAGVVCIAIIDVDHFKQINDTMGHMVADEYLVQLTSRWRTVLRSSDLLARFGGDEFCAAAVVPSRSHGVELMERLREAAPPPHTCSVGVAFWDGMESPDQLMRRADSALYRAKASGRNHLAVNRGELHRPIKVRDTGSQVRQVAEPKV